MLLTKRAQVSFVVGLTIVVMGTSLWSNLLSTQGQNPIFKIWSDSSKNFKHHNFKRKSITELINNKGYLNAILGYTIKHGRVVFEIKEDKFKQIFKSIIKQHIPFIWGSVYYQFSQHNLSIHMLVIWKERGEYYNLYDQFIIRLRP